MDTLFCHAIFLAYLFLGDIVSEGRVHGLLLVPHLIFSFAVFDHIHLNERQRVNHFRNYYELCRKDLLIKNLKRMKRQLEREGIALCEFPATQLPQKHH
jgi:hypothetical protein